MTHVPRWRSLWGDEVGSDAPPLDFEAFSRALAEQPYTPPLAAPGGLGDVATSPPSGAGGRDSTSLTLSYQVLTPARRNQYPLSNKTFSYTFFIKMLLVCSPIYTPRG